MSTGFGGALRRWLLRLLIGSGVVLVTWTAAAFIVDTKVPSSSSDDHVAIRLNADHSGHLSWQDRLTVTARQARIDRVAVTDGTGFALAGAVVQTGTVWRSTGELVPDTSYRVRAELVDAFGRGHVRTAKLTTTPPKAKVAATITPGDNDTVGVGMPIVVRLDHSVDGVARSDVIQRLEVTTNPPTAGAWRWMTAREIHWRPEVYWAPHTTVTAVVDLGGLDLGGGNWGTGSHVVHFTIGDAHVSVADAGTHTMVVTSNGQPVRTLPISAGRQAYPSRNGIHLALSKDPVVTMDSATVGIPRNSPDGYYEKVQWDVRISYAGAFVHAAPWSVPDQGQRNVSHGCINLSTADAQWFYGFTLRGDIVEIRSAGAPPDLADPGTADWNLSWDAWQA